MKTVLVIGSMNMDYTVYCQDFPAPGETQIATGREVQPGGKGANQAAASAKSRGARTLFFGARGDDADGKACLLELQKAGVDCRVETVAAPTGNATIIVNSKGENKILIQAGANALVGEVPAPLVGESDYVLLQNEIPMEANQKAIATAKRLGKTIVYNPAPAIKAGEACICFSDFLIVNETELAFYGGSDYIETAIDAVMGLGARRVLVTLGEKGSIYRGPEGDYAVDAVSVHAVDSVGAGDTYVGYFVSGLAQGKPILEAMRYASLAASIAVSRKGSLSAIPLGTELNN